jgi:hypothetical protein
VPPPEAVPQPEPEPEPEPEAVEEIATAGHGLDRLAAFVATAKAHPDDSRPRLRPAINALKRLKDRMEKPVDGTGT